MTPFRLAASLMLLSASLALLHPARAQELRALHVVVIEGRDAVNVSGASAVSPLVEVRNAKDKAVADAHVIFVLPIEGPRAVFEAGLNSMRAQTGHDGRARAGSMQAVGVGRFEIAIQADYRGQVASARIAQTNVEGTVDTAVPQAAIAEKGVGGLRMEVLEGSDGVNIIDKGTAVKSVVRVMDRNGLPVAGAAVVFTVMATRGGSKTEFSNAKATITVSTDKDGLAAAEELHPTGKGSFQVKAEVQMNGEIASQSISQGNYATELAALDAGKFPGSSTGGVSRNRPAIKVTKVDSAATDGSGSDQAAVQVSDAAGAPLARARVAFVVSSASRGAVFPNGQSYMIVETNDGGRAAFPPLETSGKGPLTIKAIVYYQGSSAVLSVPASLSSPAIAQKAPKVSHTGMSAAVKVILVVAATAGTATAIAVARGSSSTTNSGGSIHIGIGTPSVSPPR